MVVAALFGAFVLGILFTPPPVERTGYTTLVVVACVAAALPVVILLSDENVNRAGVLTVVGLFGVISVGWISWLGYRRQSKSEDLQARVPAVIKSILLVALIVFGLLISLYLYFASGLEGGLVQ